MKYVVNKIVEAYSAEQALKKAKKTPVTEVYIHNEIWKESGFELNPVDKDKLGFKDAKKAKAN